MLTENLLAENIRKYRIACNHTQTTLAQKISVSCQAISKWERGLAVPELDKLCLLADEFHISLDVLVGNTESTKKLMIGIDGGGSKTEFILFDENGTIIDKIILGGCNPNAVGIEGSVALISDGIDRLRDEHSNICGIFIGSAGFKSGGNGVKICKLLCRKYPNIKIKCDTDIGNVFASVEGDRPLIAGICGTGTIVYGKVNGECLPYTGWGYLLDRGGSGFHIGRDGLTAALEQLEGLGPKTLITELIENQLGSSLKTQIKEFYQKDPSYIASFAEIVFKAFSMGDEVAKKILELHSERLAMVINKVAEGLQGAKTVVLSGGIVKNKAFSDMLQKHLKLKIILPELSQAEGACILCAEMCGFNKEKLYAAFKAQKEK